MNEILKAWAGGFFDGEGSITIQPKQRYNLYIAVTSTEFEPIDFLVKTWNGRYSFEPRAGIGKNKRDFHQVWFFPAHREVAKRFLLDILPYLRVKKRRTEIALRWLNEIRQFDGLRPHHSRLLGIERECRKLMYQEMKALP